MQAFPQNGSGLSSELHFGRCFQHFPALPLPRDRQHLMSKRISAGGSGASQRHDVASSSSTDGRPYLVSRRSSGRPAMVPPVATASPPGAAGRAGRGWRLVDRPIAGLGL
jgi:hypothetical protein